MSKKPDLTLFAAVVAAKSLADLFGTAAAATDASIRKLRANIHADLFGGDDTAWRRLDVLIAEARGPVAPAPPRPDTRTAQGGQGFTKDAKDQLFTLGIANFVGADTFGWLTLSSPPPLAGSAARAPARSASSAAAPACAPPP